MKKIFTLLVFLLLITQFALGQVYSENFDVSSNWSSGSGYIARTYELASPQHNDKFTSDKAIREGTNVNSGPYAWRLKDNSNVYLRYECEGTISGFSIYAARWDNNPKPEVTVRYSTDSGNSYTTAFTFTGDDFTGDKVYKQFTHTFASNITNDSGKKIYIEFVTTTGERMLYDDFEVTFVTASTDADAEAADTGSQPTGTTISSTGNDDSNNPVSVFEMTFYDWGTSDGLPTHVTNVRLKPKNTNTADWTNNIGGLVLDDGSVTLTPSSVDITDTYIDIAFNSGDFDVADNTTRDLYIAIYLNTSNIEDGKILSFMVDVDNHGFTADPSGTQFKPVFDGGDFYSNDFTIGVEATEMQYQQQPTDVEVNTVMSPAVTVAYTDANGNVDVDYDGSGFATTSVTTTGTFDASATTTVDAVLGVATFDNLIFSAQGTGLTLTATDDNNLIGSNVQVTSNTFDVTTQCTNATANINEFHYDNNGADVNEFVEIYIEDPQPGTLSDYTVELYNGSGGVSYGSETLDNLTATTGTSGTYYVWEPSSIQNGPDGIALGGPCGLIEFLSYEGVFTASGGIADGVTSNDVGVEETGSTPLNSSIQLVNGSWIVTDGANTKGTENSTATSIILLNFSATNKNNSTLLEWSTSSEINNNYFSVEWSRDGRHFEEIARVKSQGNHRENQVYKYVHTNPSNGINYYRLTQYDLDGNREVFDVVSVYFDIKTQAILIAPNKVENNLRIEFEQPVEKGSLLIYDMEGQLVKNSILASGIDMINMDVSGLTAGQYIVKYIDAKGTVTRKFVKM